MAANRPGSCREFFSEILLPMDQENTIARRYAELWKPTQKNGYKGRKSSAGEELTNHFLGIIYDSTPGKDLKD